MRRHSVCTRQEFKYWDMVLIHLTALSCYQSPTKHALVYPHRAVSGASAQAAKYQSESSYLHSAPSGSSELNAWTFHHCWKGNLHGSWVIWNDLIFVFASNNMCNSRQHQQTDSKISLCWMRHPNIQHEWMWFKVKLSHHTDTKLFSVCSGSSFSDKP